MTLWERLSILFLIDIKPKSYNWSVLPTVGDDGISPFQVRSLNEGGIADLKNARGGFGFFTGHVGVEVFGFAFVSEGVALEENGGSFLFFGHGHEFDGCGIMDKKKSEVWKVEVGLIGNLEQALILDRFSDSSRRMDKGFFERKLTFVEIVRSMHWPSTTASTITIKKLWYTNHIQYVVHNDVVVSIMFSFVFDILLHMVVEAISVKHR